MINVKITLLIIFVHCMSCHGQAYNSENCIGSLKRAKALLSNYYINNDDSVLHPAMLKLDTAMTCSITQIQATDLKISLLVLLKDYQRGIEFTDSLNNDLFKLSYKKTMYHNYFIALQNEAKGDSAKRNIHLINIIDDIQQFVSDKKRINKEAYYDLFFIKSLIMTKEELNAELTVLQKVHPGNKEFFKILFESLYDEGKSTEASFN